MRPSKRPAPSLAKHLLLPLNRPQYSNLESFATAFAWNLNTVAMNRPEDDRKALALRYRKVTAGTKDGSSKTLEFRYSDPVSDKEKLDAFARALEAAGIVAEHDQKELAIAVANSICGIRPTNGKNHPAAPITEAMALLQNSRGLAGAKNPPNLALIVEGLFGLGRSSSSLASAAGLWQEAMKHRCAIDPLACGIDTAIRETLLEALPLPSPPLQGDPASDWFGMFPDTPFTGFHRMWEQITSPEWVEALPARVWVDWASTVLRMGLGMGFLWEAAWYEGIARCLLDIGDTAVTFEVIRNAMPSVLPWRSEVSAISVRDVSSILKRRVVRSDLIRETLRNWITQNEQDEIDLGQAINEMRKAPKLLSKIEAHLGTPPKNAGNTWEAIRYSLLIRNDSGQYADHYGMLRSSGTRYLLPDPGTEWMSVVASLSCAKPGSKTTLGTAMKALHEFGLTPPLSDVVMLLERAGLARGSADADQGVLIQSAF